MLPKTTIFTKRTPPKARTAALLLGAVLLAAGVANAALVNADKLGVIKFQAIGPGGLKIDGEGGGLTASEDGGVIKLSVPISTLKTGIDLRDSHMKDKYLEAGKHPTAEMKIKRADLKFPADNASSTGNVQAEFTFHGTTKPVKVDYKVDRTGSDFHVQGNFEVAIDQYKIEQPCYLGVCVDKQVKVKAKFKLREQ